MRLFTRLQASFPPAEELDTRIGKIELENGYPSEASVRKIYDEIKWVKTVPGKGWFAYFRAYSPTEAFFDKSWKLPDFEVVPNSGN